MSGANFDHETPDGVHIHVHGWAPASPKAVIHIMHGMAEHGARYARLAARLNDQGYAVFAHDHRGHGGTIADNNPIGHMADEDGWNKAVADAYAVNRDIAARVPGIPMIAMGHSMGSFIVQQILYESPQGIDAVVLSGTSGKPPPIAALGRGIARVERRRVGKRATSRVIQLMTFEKFNKQFSPARTDNDWLSRDPAEVDKYNDDPLCGFRCTTQFWTDFLDALPKIAVNVLKMPKHIPVYLFAGDEDPAGENGHGVHKLHRALETAGVRNLQIKLYPKGRHEMLNEVNRDEVMDDLLAWCENTYASLTTKNAA